MATYHIEPERRTLHGHFSRDLPPVLTIKPGDSIQYRTLDAGWGLEQYRGGERRKFEPRDPELDKGHALCGPIFIEGAEPAMTIEVRIGEIVPGSFGWTVAGGWSNPTNDWLGVGEGSEQCILSWDLDPTTMTGRNQLGHIVTLKPFMGVLGMPPADPGTHPTAPPRVTGGNIDCKELVTGSTLYLPIAVPGGLFSVGDGHALQGDGEFEHYRHRMPDGQSDPDLQPAPRYAPDHSPRQHPRGLDYLWLQRKPTRSHHDSPRGHARTDAGTS